MEEKKVELESEIDNIDKVRFFLKEIKMIYNSEIIENIRSIKNLHKDNILLQIDDNWKGNSADQFSDFNEETSTKIQNLYEYVEWIIEKIDCEESKLVNEKLNLRYEINVINSKLNKE